MSTKDGELVDVYRTVFDYCVTESAETRNFWIHGVIALLLCILNILVAIVIQVQLSHYYKNLSSCDFSNNILLL